MCSLLVRDGRMQKGGMRMSKGAGKGLEGIAVAESAISSIDGQKGTLRYRGIDIGELATNASYEETAYLLWFGELPTGGQLTELRDKLAASRELDESVWNMLLSFPCWPQPMEALRTAVSALSSCDPYAGDESREANINKAVYITAKMPTIVAHYHRHSTGQERVRSDPELDHAANFLYMLHGERPSDHDAESMNKVMVLLAEHGMNASTFAGRVTGSTLSDMYSAITSAIGTLKGPLHGGANQRAMEMLLEIGDASNAESFVSDALAAKRRIMGFGHRVYKTIDPRATQLREAVCTLDEREEDSKWCSLALEVAESVASKKELYPNVDFYSAPLLYTLGIPLDLFTPVFAMSRIVGWTAHVMEQQENNRLIRPLSTYVGPEPRPYVPVGDR
jgi:citrate synthase